MSEQLPEADPKICIHLQVDTADFPPGIPQICRVPALRAPDMSDGNRALRFGVCGRGLTRIEVENGQDIFKPTVNAPRCAAIAGTVIQMGRPPVNPNYL